MVRNYNGPGGGGGGKQLLLFLARKIIFDSIWGVTIDTIKNKNI